MHCQQSLLLFIFLLLCSVLTASLPLSTRSRWIVDAASGHRVKLRCVNWAAHMQTVLAEGLDRQPLSAITAKTASLGFNCVRLTYATQLFTSQQYEHLTVAASLGSLGLMEALLGVRSNNPSMMTLTVRDAYEEVVREIGRAGLMVVLDNHVSKPQWCCGGDDGNGFFGDRYFDVDEWLRGLQLVAGRFRLYPQVVGMSMRNELRGPNQTEDAWYTNVARGAATIHSTNPNLLVIISGLSFDTDLSFLARRPLSVPFTDKLVLEAHWYSFGNRRDWAEGPPARVCSDSARTFDSHAAFVSHDTPLFVSEFGIDQRGTNRGDNRFLTCFLAFAAERDLDWAMWALQGSYYLRNGQAGFEETFGVLDSSWTGPKNPRFRDRFGLVQQTLIEPGSNSPAYQILYHPASGKCAGVDVEGNVALVGCGLGGRWSYQEDGRTVRLAATTAAGVWPCLRAAGDGSPVRLSAECEGVESGWGVVGGFQVGGVDGEGRQLCLDGGDGLNSSLVVARECLCVEGFAACDGNPLSQWFRFVTSNVGF